VSSYLCSADDRLFKTRLDRMPGEYGNVGDGSADCDPGQPLARAVPELGLSSV